MKKLKTEYALVMRKLSDTKYGDLFTMAEFMDMVRNRTLVNDDGHGFYANDKAYSNIYAKPSNMIRGEIEPGWTHVIWFNK